MTLRQRLTIYDLFERHAVVDQLLRDSLAAESPDGVILDVGGRRGLLAAYTSWPVIAVNPDGTGDLVNDSTALPFADNAFAAVVSLDTLEHMPQVARLDFLAECLRVASQLLLVAAPLGSPSHVRREEALNELFYAAHGYYHEYLNEHVQFGLPTLEELATYWHSLPNEGTALYFAGSFVWQANAFERSLTTAKLPRLLALPFNILHRIVASALFHPVDLRTQADETANRFYLVLYKQ